MVDAFQILKVARELGSSATLDQIQIAINQIDRAVLEAQERQRYRVEIWDKKSAINGVPAEKVLASRDDIPADGEVYLIYVDDHLVYFQPHDPDQGGIVPIPEGKGVERGQQHVSALVGRDVDQRVMEEVLRQIL